MASGLIVAHIVTGAHSLTLSLYAPSNAATPNTEPAVTTYTVVVVLEVVDEQHVDKVRRGNGNLSKISAENTGSATRMR